ncbi:decaprenyl-phosphate phosphoribosyltransferase [Geomonas paludis]|uniref:Decaprenyl-phosphate phosphoribosyltransferase n=1 Tax=Geomonas paludis TaxID=2740185 RepID=A0A6V8MW15_9BACT|nr:decaprenyl-phosphate phosphoribosyltransferase [Geomonas paludis]UPU34391.1 decaprenyl-phosphate phosphoribosyltransferase [Geomonas paludis]GFO64376.1 decaprenyl-phosphate phosphoribosyltransferase [Geomonas paludis]
MMTHYLIMLRPTQWLKNLMLFFPLVLSGQLLTQDVVVRGGLAFVSFCLVSSAGYVFNDLLDRERDTFHPKKSNRPIPSGKVSAQGAALCGAVLLAAGIAIASRFPAGVWWLILSYIGVTLSYSLIFKSVALMDLFCISAGFLIRLYAGAEAFAIPISPWLFLTVFLLAIFLSTGKRLGESFSLGDAAGDHRASLAGYPPGFLAGTMYMTGSAVLVTYTMYVVSRPRLVYTVPLCLFGLLRYTIRVASGANGDPTDSLLKDWVLFLVSLAWAAVVIWSVYR